VEEMVRTTNPNGTTRDSLARRPGPISLDQIRGEFTLLYQALRPGP
jgi:hypothetical protein